MKTPVIVGISQLKQGKDVPDPDAPIELIERACRSALSDAGPERLWSLIDTLYMTNTAGWPYRDAPARLCELLDIRPARTTYPFIGGDYPQKFINMGAKQITRGDCDVILFAGGEAEYAIRRAGKGLVELQLPPQEEPEKYDGGRNISTSDFENDYNLLFPIGLYVFFETVLKEISGRSWDEHNQYIGTILERYSKVSSKNSNAWTQIAYSCEEIITPAENNRYLCYPYTLRMMANRLVDMSAAIVMTSTETATKLGVEREKWIYPMGGADLENIYYATQRPELHTSPAAYYGSRLALEQAGLSLNEIDIFDIYSCFPSMIQIFLNEIGLGMDDPRGLTITGGLPYFGAPISNYSMHAIVTAVERIREKPSTKAFVAALGGINTKPSFCIYGDEPSDRLWGERDDSGIQEDILSVALPEPVKEASGNFRIEAYAIHFDRSGSPELGTVTGMLDSGVRTLAHIDAGPDELEDVKDKNMVGQNVEVKYNPDKAKNFVKL